MILTVTLNASIDKAYYLAEPLQPGKVMRVKECRNTAGGKGLNVSRVVKLCGGQVLATGLVGGFNGQYLEYLLKEDKIASQFTHVAGETRSCINVLESAYGSTEFLEAGCQISQAELAEFITNYRALLADIEVVTLSGSLPQGVSQSVYVTLIDLAKKAGKQVLLDSSGESFRLGLAAKPSLIKPNKDELEAFFGVEISSTEETIAYAKKLAAEGIDYVVISLGGDGAVLLHDGVTYHAKPQPIKPVNTVGCGDSMVAALALGLERKDSPEECLKYAVAVGTANALSQRTGHFEQADLDSIYQGVTVQLLD